MDFLSEKEVPTFDGAHGFTAEFAREFARAIDLAMESEDEQERAIRLEVEKLTAIAVEAEKERVRQVEAKKGRPPENPTNLEDIERYLSQMAILLENASTSEEQLNCSNGLPMLMDPVTKRFRLAPTAAAIVRFQFFESQLPPPKLNPLASTLFMSRTAAAKEAKEKMAQEMSS
jgi:hypothetical protein